MGQSVDEEVKRRGGERRATAALGRRTGRAGRPSRISLERRLWTVLSVLIAAGIWEGVGHLTSPLVFVPLSNTLNALWHTAIDGTLWTDLRVSGIELGIGLGAGIVVGLAGAILSYLNKFVRYLTDPWVSAVNTLPYVAVAPLFIVEFGLGLTSKVMLVFLATFVTIWLSASSGLVGTDPQLLEVVRAFDATKMQTVRYVLMPWAVPSLFNGLRLALSRGIIAVVVGELLGGTSGIGVMISNAGSSLDTPTLLAGVLAILVITLALVGCFKWLQSKAVPWWDLME